MTRAEQAALKAYPEKLEWDYRDMDYDPNMKSRIIFLQGYERAEKDLALTKDDVWCIFNLVRELQTKYPATEGCLQEVADIFNGQRNGDH